MNPGRFLFKIMAIVMALPIAQAFASPATLTYQGRILRADGTPLEYSNVSFIFQVTDPLGQCVIFQEQVDGINMVNSRGVFDVPIGGGVVQYPLGGPASILDAFNSSSTFTCGTCSLVAGHYTCSDSSSSYTPSGGDTRKLRVSFYDGTGWKMISPDSVVRTVPFAAYSVSAQKLGNNVATDFVTKAGLPNCIAGEFLTWNGASLSCAAVSGSSGGTVTNVLSGNAYLTITNSSSIPSLTVNVGQVANTVAAGNDNRIVNALQIGTTTSGDLSGTLPSPTVAKIQGVAVSVTAPIAGEFFKYNGTSWAPSVIATTDVAGLTASLNSYLTQSAFTSELSNANCTTSQSLYWNSVSSHLACQSINVGLVGDVTGSVGAAKVVALQNNPVDTTAPISGQALAWNGIKWTPTTMATSLPPSGSASGDLSGTYPSPTIAKISGTALLISSLSSGNYLKYNGTNWINATPASSDLSDGSSLIKSSQMPANCSAGQTLTFSSPTGTWSCSNIVVTASNFGAQNANTFLAGPVTGNAAPTFRSLASSDLPSGVVAVGAYNSVSVDTYGRVIAGTNPTTVAGYGITDAFVNGGNLFGAAANLGTNDNNVLNFKTNNSNRMTISVSGNVGIGTTSPNSPLQVQGNIAAVASQSSTTVSITNDNGTSSTNNNPKLSVTNFMGSSSGYPQIALTNYGGSGASPSAVGAGAILGNISVAGANGSGFNVNSGAQINFTAFSTYSAGNAATDISFLTAPSGSTSAATVMTVSHTGGVGIGTTTPGQALTVAGTIQSTSGGIMFPDGTVQTTSVPMTKWTSAGAAVIGAETTAPTKGTTTTDKLLWRRVNDTMEINWNMVMSGAGSIGSGYYLLTIPGGYAIDTTKLSVPSSSPTTMAGVGTIGIFYSAGTGICNGTVYAYNATQLFAQVVCQNGGVGSGPWGSSYLNFSMPQNTNIKASFPIAGW